MKQYGDEEWELRLRDAEGPIMYQTKSAENQVQWGFVGGGGGGVQKLKLLRMTQNTFWFRIFLNPMKICKLGFFCNCPHLDKQPSHQTDTAGTS